MSSMINNRIKINGDFILRLTGMLMLFVFINFTIVIPCLNFSGYDISISEMVEEEEEEEQEDYEKVLHDDMFRSMVLDRYVQLDIHKENLQVAHEPEVLTPPPQDDTKG